MDFFDTMVAWDGGLTLLAPAVAILMALATKRVVPSLATAAVVGALVASRGDPIHGGELLVGFVWSAVADIDHITISAFSLLVAATVGVMSRSGGTRALIQRIEGLAQGPRGAMVASWLAGLLVFFDDYANCLIVGSAMGPLYDRYRISRAKLAYIVDATAAPIASLAVISTWVGFEVEQLEKGLGGTDIVPFELFLEALPYRFYCVFTLVFVMAIALFQRDFGPMHAVEVEARRTRSDAVVETTSAAASHAVLAGAPIAVLIGLTFALLVHSGRTSLGEAAAGAALFQVLGAANPYPPMFWGSLGALGTAGALSVALRALGPREVLVGAGKGARAVMLALVVLYLAWTLGDIIKETGAGAFIKGALADQISPWMLPALTFVVSAATAFSTGSSFFTMGVLLPTVLPVAVAMDPAGGPVLLASCAAVLDGAVLGDHASPISDTTILSSIGASVDIVTHVQTQLPYVLVVGAIAVVCGAIPAGLGMGPLVTLPVGSAAAVAAVRVLGRPVTA